MYFSRIRISNYKSYYRSGEIVLNQGINIIVGKNNSGKTSFLEFLSGNAESKPHLNLESKPRLQSPVKAGDDYGKLEICISQEELKEIVDDKLDNIINIFNDEVSAFHVIEEKDEDGSYFYFSKFHDNGGYYLPATAHAFYEKTKLFNNEIFIWHALPHKNSMIRGLYPHWVTSGGINVVQISHPDYDDQILLKTTDSKNEISQILCEEFFKSRVYKFNVHRVIQPKNDLNDFGKFLHTDCRNLPSALNYLKGDPTKFKELEELLKEVFPEIKQISISQEEGTTIKVWLPQTTRADLAINLSECGTGIGQVMAMLYVVISSHNSQVIIIDEPNSFLHPSASRKLMEIFKRYNQHQYIISTHSPEVISSANPENIILLRLNEKGQTQVQKIDRKSREHMQEILNEVGGKLSDVFGYDKILWVEGETEELCFPKIVENVLKASLTNSPIRRVYDTGSFEKKHIQTTLYIYNRLVEGDALIPPSLAFIFDREGRSEKDIQDLEREGKGRIRLLKRRLYENYLLDADAIEAVLKRQADNLIEEGIEADWVKEVSLANIESYIQECISDKKFWSKKTPTPNQEKNWLEEIHAADILKSLFSKLTEDKVSYRKTTHSVELTEWLIENKPEKLQEIVDLLSEFYHRA